MCLQEGDLPLPQLLEAVAGFSQIDATILIALTNKYGVDIIQGVIDTIKEQSSVRDIS